MPSVVCPECGDRVAVLAGSEDRPVRCPSCDARIEPPRRREPRTDRPRRRKPRVLLIVGIVFAVLFVTCGGAGTLFYFLFIHEIEEPVAATDKEVVVTAEYLATFGDDIAVNANKGKFRKVRYLDRSREVSYEYGTADEDTEPIAISHTVCLEKNASDARSGYAGLQLGFRLAKAAEIQEVERNDLWKWGDESRCVVLHSQGKPTGNLFMARKGRKFFILVFSGLYFDKAEAIKAFLDPLLQKLDNYEG